MLFQAGLALLLTDWCLGRVIGQHHHHRHYLQGDRHTPEYNTAIKTSIGTCLNPAPQERRALVHQVPYEWTVQHAQRPQSTHRASTSYTACSKRGSET